MWCLRKVPFLVRFLYVYLQNTYHFVYKIWEIIEKTKPNVDRLLIFLSPWINRTTWPNYTFIRSCKITFLIYKVFCCIFQISRKTFRRIRKLSYTNFYRDLVTWSGWSMALRYMSCQKSDLLKKRFSAHNTKNTILSAVHWKLAFSVSFCVRKVNFPPLVRYNFKFVLIFRTIEIFLYWCGKIKFPHAKRHRQS